jgi:hypothetical protein
MKHHAGGHCRQAEATMNWTLLKRYLSVHQNTRLHTISSLVWPLACVGYFNAVLRARTLFYDATSSARFVFE